MENDNINRYKEYMSNQFSIKLNTKMEDLSVMYQILKMHKNGVGLGFTIA